MRTSYFLGHIFGFAIFHNQFFFPVGRIPFCYVREKYGSITNFFPPSLFGPKDITLSNIRKESEPGKDFGAIISLITTIEVDLCIVLEEVETGYMGILFLVASQYPYKSCVLNLQSNDIFRININK